MELNDWFTIISILLAVFAFFSQEERQILLLKTNKYQVWSTIFLLVILVPLLLFFNKLSYVFPLLKKCPFSFNCFYLPTASTWAFLLTILTFGCWGRWILFKLNKTKPTEKLMKHYLKSMDTMSFEDLFKLFIKYEGNHIENESYYSLYGIVLTNKSFFNAAFNYKPNLFSDIVKNIDAPTILNSKLPVTIKDKIISLASEQKRLGLVSTYNYEPVLHDKWPKEDLLLFQLTDSYFLMMEQCIEENNFDEGNFKMLNSFSVTMYTEILNSISLKKEVDYNKASPTYFHKLLSDFTDAFDNWIKLAVNNKLDLNVVDHFSKIYCNCIVLLIKHDDKIISEYYLKIQFDSFLNNYFNDLQQFESVLTNVEDELVRSLTNDDDKKDYYKIRFNSCWEYTDDKQFAGSSGVLEREKNKRNRFIKNVVEKI